MSDVQRVLEAFRCMGATPRDLAREEARMKDDDEYYDVWIVRMAEWYAEAPTEKANPETDSSRN